MSVTVYAACACVAAPAVESSWDPASMAADDPLREQRQLALMQQRLADFRTGMVEIGRTVNDLEALLQALEGVSPDWRERFVDEWGYLEIAYAVALDRVAPLPTIQDPEVAEAVEALERLVDEALART